MGGADETLSFFEFFCASSSRTKSVIDFFMAQAALTTESGQLFADMMFDGSFDFFFCFAFHCFGRSEICEMLRRIMNF